MESLIWYGADWKFHIISYKRNGYIIWKGKHLEVQYRKLNSIKKWNKCNSVEKEATFRNTKTRVRFLEEYPIHGGFNLWQISRGKPTKKIARKETRERRATRRRGRRKWFIELPPSRLTRSCPLNPAVILILSVRLKYYGKSGSTRTNQDFLILFWNLKVLLRNWDRKYYKFQKEKWQKSKGELNKTNPLAFILIVILLFSILY